MRSPISRTTVKEGKAYNIAFATSTPKTDARPYPIFARIMSSFTILPADYTPKGKVLALEHLVHKVRHIKTGTPLRGHAHVR